MQSPSQQPGTDDLAALEEWNRVSARGASARRRALFPIVLGAILFTLAFGGTFLGLGSALGARAAERKAALAERGLEEVVVRRSAGSSRRLSDNEQAVDGGVLLFVLAFAAGTGAGALGFFLSGGKISAEHARGISALR